MDDQWKLGKILYLCRSKARSADRLLARLCNDACCESINAFDYRDSVRADSMRD